MSPNEIARTILLLTGYSAVGAVIVTLLLDRVHRRRAVSVYGLLLATLASYWVWKYDDYAQLDLGFFLYLAFFLAVCTFCRIVFLLVFEARPLGLLFRRVPHILLECVWVVILLAALLTALHVGGVEPNSLVASSAVITAALGFLMKDTLSNSFSGLALQLESPFSVGDWIQYDNERSHIGRVTQMNWRATKIITLDEVQITIPNGVLAATAITVFTQPTQVSRRNIYFTAPYDKPPYEVQRIALEAIRDMTTIVADPAPSVVTWNYTERGIEYWARIFTTLFHQRDRVDGECRDRIWYALQRHGITMPGIQQNLRFARRPKPNARRATEQRRYRILSDVDFLRELSDDALVRLAEHSKSRLYGAGEKLIRQGECTSELFVLTRGSVRISKHLDDEKEIELATLVAPAVLGEMCLLTGEPRSATATTLEPTRCLVIDKRALAPILTEAPTLVSKISQVITDRHAKNKLIADSHTEPAEGDDSDLLGSIKRFFGLDE